MLVAGVALLVLIVGQNALDIAHKAGSQNSESDAEAAALGFMPVLSTLAVRH